MCYLTSCHFDLKSVISTSFLFIRVLTSSILRCAAAFGVDAVFIGPECADPLNPRSLRASAGAALTLPYSTHARALAVRSFLLLTESIFDFR